MSFHPKEAIIDYTNWRGERKVYRVRPQHIMFSSNQWHPEKQWLMQAMVVPTNYERVFAMKDIHSWRPAP